MKILNISSPKLNDKHNYYYGGAAGNCWKYGLQFAPFSNKKSL